MAGPYDFTGQNIENTYQRVLQTPNGTTFYDGTGSLVTLPSANTASLLTTASATGNTITFTKGNGSTFPVTVTGGSGTPTFPYTGSAIISGSLIITGSLTTNDGVYVSTITASFISASGGITGSLFGTSSWASSASVAISSSYSSTASYALNGGVTKILAGSNISLSPTNGLGQVTITSTGGGSSFNTATGSYGSFYSTITQTNVAGTARSMSLNITDITNGVSISGSTDPFNTYIKTENPGVYDIQFSAQVDKTDSGTDEIWIWLRKNGTDLSDTATSVQLTGNGAHYVAAWNFFVNSSANDYYQLMWYSPDANVRLHAEPAFGVVPGIPSLIVTANRVDTFLSNTGSFSGSFTGNLMGTASYASQSLSSSYATTASYNPNALITASAAGNDIQFTKGNGSTFTITVDTGSGGGNISGLGLEHTLALWDTQFILTSSSITLFTSIGATDKAVVSESLYNVDADGLKIGSLANISQITSSINSNIFVNNISPSSNFIQVSSTTPAIIKHLNLYDYNIVNKSGCYGMIIDFNLLLSNQFDIPQDRYTYNANAWPDTSIPYYVETGRIYLSWLGADPNRGGAEGKGNSVTYLTMAPTIGNAIGGGWDQVAVGTPSITSLGASEEGVVAPYGAPLYRDADGGYQFGYKLVNNPGTNPGTSEWYVEVAVWNDTSTNLYITHTTKILTLSTNI